MWLLVVRDRGRRLLGIEGRLRSGERLRGSSGAQLEDGWGSRCLGCARALWMKN